MVGKNMADAGADGVDAFVGELDDLVRTVIDDIAVIVRAAEQAVRSPAG